MFIAYAAWMWARLVWAAWTYWLCLLWMLLTYLRMWIKARWQ